MYIIKFFHEGGIEYTSSPINSAKNALFSAKYLENIGLSPLVYEKTEKGEKQISIARLDKIITNHLEHIK